MLLALQKRQSALVIVYAHVLRITHCTERTLVQCHVLGCIVS